MPSRHRAGRKPEPRAAKGAIIRTPKAPAHLTPEARAAWKRVAPLIIASGAFTAVHLPLLENYAMHLGRVVEIEATLRTTTAVADVARLVRLQDAASKTALRYAAELYASPAAGSRLIASAGEDDDDLADLGLGA